LNSQIQQANRNGANVSAWLFSFLCEAALDGWLLYIEGGVGRTEQQLSVQHGFL
jgi:hypothetical protein